MRHRATLRTCSQHIYFSHVKKAGFCVRHGAMVKCCSREGCINGDKKRRVGEKMTKNVATVFKDATLTVL